MDFYVARDSHSCSSVMVIPAVIGIVAEKDTCNDVIDFYYIDSDYYQKLTRQERKEIDFDRRLVHELVNCMQIGLNLCREMFKFIPKEGTAWHVYIKKGKVVKEQVFLEPLYEHGC